MLVTSPQFYSCFGPGNRLDIVKKKDIVYGEKVFFYSLMDRQHGARILTLAGICFILLLTLTIIALMHKLAAISK